jgi:hypothetical protein
MAVPAPHPHRQVREVAASDTAEASYVDDWRRMLKHKERSRVRDLSRGSPLSSAPSSRTLSPRGGSPRMGMSRSGTPPPADAMMTTADSSRSPLAATTHQPRYMVDGRCMGGRPGSPNPQGLSPPYLREAAAAPRPPTPEHAHVAAGFTGRLRASSGDSSDSKDATPHSTHRLPARAPRPWQPPAAPPAGGATSPGLPTRLHAKAVSSDAPIAGAESSTNSRKRTDTTPGSTAPNSPLVSASPARVPPPTKLGHGSPGPDRNSH